MVLSFGAHVPDYLTSKVLISQKKALHIILKQPPNSPVLNKFNDLKIMLVFCFLSLVIFYSKCILALEDNFNFVENSHQY